MSAVVASLRARLDEVLDPLLAGVSRCALVDFPNHANVGDSAIWLGERALLGERGIDVAYVCDLDTYTRTELRSALGPRDAILLHGGGNFGDLYPRHERLRERVVTDFPRHRIVQLPQTVRFESPAAAGRARDVLSGHPDFHVLVRDEVSVRTATGLGLDARLSPDAAFALGTVPRAEPAIDVLWLARTDRERLSGGLPEIPGTLAVEVADWLPGPPRHPAERSAAALRAARRRVLAVSSPARRAARRRVAPRLDDLASGQVARGVALLSRGRVVVTDRLHGHILSLLLGIPHVVLDTRHGKVSGFRELWTRDAETVVPAATPADALTAATRLLTG